MNIKERISVLRKLMDEKGIDAYIIPSSDYHQSEYVGDYFKCRKFISGFTGSAGTVVVTKEEAGLWTDGRYFIQAAKELEGTGVTLFKMGEENVPTYEQYIYNSLKENSVVGFDGRVVSAYDGLALEKELSSKNMKIKYDCDLIGNVWKDRPSMSDAKAFKLDLKYAGVSTGDKITILRDKMKKQGATMNIIASLDDIAWLFNIRGGDVQFNPVVLSYTVVTLNETYLFIDKAKLNDEILSDLEKEKVIIKDYFGIYDFVKAIDEKEKVLLFTTKINYTIYNDIPEKVEKIDAISPTIYMKARKNEIEIENLRNCHVKDGVAFTKFMYWLKKNIEKEEITELSASEKLAELRKEQEGFLDLSFGTIAGYKDHAAMMHYSATKESDVKLEPEHLFLIDSGGQYCDGTTDITRTIALGNLTEELKKHFTTVLRSMISLSRAKFLYGARGYNLDILARNPIWQLGIDYKCGSGHGVGFLLNVHEGPMGFRWEKVIGKLDYEQIEEGNVITNEPGIYIEGSHGIRIENELVVKKDEKNEFGQFMNFEAITYAPIDLDAVNVDLLTYEEKTYLNFYHKLVFEKIAAHLTEEEKEWLKEYTREI